MNALSGNLTLDRADDGPQSDAAGNRIRVYRKVSAHLRRWQVRQTQALAHSGAPGATWPPLRNRC